MLPHHRQRAGRRGALVVVGDQTSCCNEHVADAGQHRVIDRTEPASLDRLPSRHHPRPRALGLEPPIAHLIGPSRVVESELQASRLSGNMPHALPQRVVGGEDASSMRRHIDHAVVGGEQNARIRRQLSLERSESAIELIESREPAIGGDTVGVAGHIELGNIHVDEPTAALSQQTHRRADAIVDRLRRVESGAPQHGVGEPGDPVALGPDDDGLHARMTGLLEHRVVRLPLARSHRRIPP